MDGLDYKLGRLKWADPFLMVQSLDKMLSSVMVQDTQFSFRISAARLELDIDLNPTAEKLSKLVRLVIAELESKVSRVDQTSQFGQNQGKGSKPSLKALAVESKGKGKGKEQDK